ncbi:MAG: NAD-dependent epimerase/dehydratase family protein [Acidimicrobiales bacterium]
MTPGAQPRLLLTGAAGRIGRAVLPALSEHWEVAATDLPGRGCAVLDVTDLAACRQACSGVDAVVHMAGNPSTEAPWEDLLPANVTGAYNIAQGAVDAGVRRGPPAGSGQQHPGGGRLPE